ncbi:MAG: CbiX/SirB N-terminal domain-containing protein [Propionibacteriaceae bacterium]|nr:CbiX/SirB N-terminal domain-containing protein [Propionibacteriaceae bacterium]
MAAPGIVLVARGDDDPAVLASLDAVIRQLQALRPDLQVTLGLINSATPTVEEAVQDLALTGTAEIAMVPMDLTSATDHSPILGRAAAVVGAKHPDLSIVISRPIGPAVELLNVLDAKLREALHRANAVEVDSLVLACPDGGDVRGVSLLARRARQWGAHHKLPVQLAQNDITGRATAQAIAALRTQGRRHIAVGSLFLTSGPVFRAHHQAAVRAGALAVTSPITEDPRVTELILARYAFAAMRLLDVDPHEE